MANDFDSLPEIAKAIWLTGFIESKCTFYSNVIYIQFVTRDRDIAERFVDIAKCGTISEGIDGKRSKYYRVKVCNIPDVLSILIRVAPFITKKKQALITAKIKELKETDAYKRYLEKAALAKAAAKAKELGK